MIKKKKRFSFEIISFDEKVAHVCIYYCEDFTTILMLW